MLILLTCTPPPVALTEPALTEPMERRLRSMFYRYVKNAERGCELGRRLRAQRRLRRWDAPLKLLGDAVGR